MLVRKNFILLFVLFFFFGCGNLNKSEEEIQKDWLVFENKDYSIKYPPSWALNQSGYLGSSFLLISKQTSIRDFYQENVSLEEELLIDTVINLQNYVQQAFDKLEKTVPKVVIVENLLQESEESVFHKLTYEKQEGINKITIEKYYFLKENTAYILTFSGKSLEMKRYKPIGEGILNSFKLK